MSGFSGSTRAFAVALAGMLLASCASSDPAAADDFTDSSSYAAGRGAASDPPQRAAPAGQGAVVSVPAAEHAKLREFVNRRSTLLADNVEVDLSRKPFLAATVFTISPDAVRRTDQVDGALGITTITLTNTTGIRTALHALPKVRIGDGLEIIAVDRIVLRYRTKQTVERPIHLRAVGTGSAAYLVEGPPPERHKGSRVTLSGEVRRSGAGYRFAESVENQP